jgi:Bacterial regulatory protein, Fis family
MSLVRTPFLEWQRRQAVRRIRVALVLCNGNRAHAARRIGMNRVSLSNMLDEQRAIEDAETDRVRPELRAIEEQMRKEGRL